MVFRAIFDKIKAGLSKTRGVFSGIASLFRLRGRVDRDFLAQLEERLYLADVGTSATSEIVQEVRQSFLDKEITGDVEDFVKARLKGLLSAGGTLHRAPSGPTVILVAGVNGSGKTTSIAKLAYNFHQEGKKVMVAACDTFRAAAVEQLTIWSQRIGCEIVKNQPGSDPGSVAHDACDRAKARGFDVLIVDTAGRLHTQTHLMRELEKIHRVVSRQIEGAPHEVLLVLDATTGQNAISQAEQFKKTVRCTGIILAKLDGTAKGGAIFAIKQKLDLPVKFIGVGEKLDDLEPFDPDAYVEALFAEPVREGPMPELCLVTGGAGFIGSHLVEALTAAGRRVRVLDDLSTGLAENLAHIRPAPELLHGDVADAAAARAADGAAVVFHLAALASVQRSVEAPADSHRACATGTLTVLDAARRAGARRLVYAASSSAYGVPPREVQSEDDPLRPLSPYAAAKLAGEMYAEAFAATYGMETVRLRFFNVFGPRQRADSPYSGVIALFAAALSAGRAPTVFGDGLQSRDFVFVSDVVAALLRAADAPGVSGRVYNVGTGRGTTVLDLVAALNRLLGTDIAPAHAPPRPGDVRHSRADVSRARRDLGFQPAVAFEDGLDQTLRWLRRPSDSP